MKPSDPIKNAKEFLENISSMTPDDFEKYQSDSTQKIVDICLRLLILENAINDH